MCAGIVSVDDVAGPPLEGLQVRVIGAKSHRCHDENGLWIEYFKRRPVLAAVSLGTVTSNYQAG